MSTSEKIDVFSFTENPFNGYFDINNQVSFLRVQLFSENVIRFRYKKDNLWERDFSYAVVQSPIAVDYKISEENSTLKISLVNFNLFINKSDLSITIKDKKGHIISQDLSINNEKHYENGTNKITYKKEIKEGEHFYGLGDKPDHPDLRGKKFTIWGTDQYGYYHYTDPLYKNIPFFIGLHSYQAYGFFLDNTYKSSFDFGLENKEELSIEVEGGELNYYFIYGPEMIDVTSRYTLLTGVPELPPLWALGYQQCKWSYHPESNVREVTERLRKEKIPCDVFYFDIDYMDGFRCFTWDNEKFPDPKKLISDLKENGFKSVVIIDPGIKIDEEYSVFNEGLKNNYFCKAGEGGYISGKVWPGDCYFPDYTNPTVREWWANLFEELIKNQGIKGVWNDMNEPALFDVPNKSFPLDVRHDFDGEECSHKKAHNVYGMQMSRATYEGVKKFSYPDRPLVITRSTYSGGQRFSSAWTGDNIASWDHLHVANNQTQRLSISGFSFCGSDVGGFIDQPSPELYVRWVALAMMHPFFRTHSSGDHGDQEPWSFGEEALNLVRKFIEIRYMFLPYIYSTFYEYVKQGKPMLRPIYMYDQHDFHTHYRADEVILGNHVLFAPMAVEGQIEKKIFLPKGNWYYYYNHFLYEGGREHIIEFPLSESPLFIKAGAILAQAPIMNYVGEKNIDILSLNVYFKKGNEISNLYEDNGDGYDYTIGISNEVKFTFENNKNESSINQQRIGSFIPQYKSYQIQFVGFENISEIIIDGTKLNLEKNIIVPYDFKNIKIYTS